MSDELVRCLRDLADRLEADDETDDLPVHDGYQMVAEVYRRGGVHSNDPFIVYRDEDGDGWIRCGESWSCFRAGRKQFADAIREANGDAT